MRDKWIACLEGAVLAFLIAFASVMCLPTAFDLSVNHLAVALCCAAAALVCALCFTLRLGLAPPVCMVFAAGYLWRQGSLSQAVESLLFQISVIYDQGYGLGVFYWSESPPPAGDVTYALCAIGCILALAAAWTVCRRQLAAFTVLPSLLPLAACLVVTDRVPAEIYLFSLFFGLAVLLLSQSTRQKSIPQGNALAAIAALPVLLALLVLFWAVPQGSYDGQARADRILQQVQLWAQNISGTGAAAPVTQEVSLDDTGRLLQLHTPVMSVKADTGRTLYLREQGFNRYRGTSWRNENGINIHDGIKWAQFGEAAGQVTVTTRNLHDAQFVPYYTAGAQVNADGITENKKRLYSYTFDVVTSPNLQVSAHRSYLTAQTMPDALSLPEETAQWAVPLAQSITQDESGITQMAEAIGDYVRQSALYSKSTPRIPREETDFARWFLEESDTGYCVHFATAAAVLLRAAGIPAQYVTGYMVKTDGERTVTVYQDQAHAWVEYYDPVIGWRLLECTPPEGLQTWAQTGNEPEVTSTPTTEMPSQVQTPEQTAPSIGITPEAPADPGKQDGSLPPALWWLVALLAAALLIVGQWQLRVRLRERKLHSGTTNACAIACWQEILCLSRLLKERPQPELFAIAQRAKFSQHTITPQELAPLDSYIRKSRQRLKKRPWYLQAIYTLLLALY